MFTEPVSVEGAADSVAESVSVGVEDPVLRLLDPPRVRVTARIREVEETRTLAALEVEVRGGRATLRPAAVEVVLSGRKAPKDGLDDAVRRGNDLLREFADLYR